MKVYSKPELTLYGSLDIGVDASPSNSNADCLCDCAQGVCTNVGAFNCDFSNPGETCVSGLGCTCDSLGNCT